jgi:hypothetical protein
MDKNDLLDQFVSTFPKFDDMSATRELNPVAWELRINEPGQWGRFKWRPARVTTNPSFLDAIYEKIPSRFARLYEHLVLSYRWDTVYLDSFKLLPNPPGPDLSGLLAGIMADKALWENLVPAGYVQFGQGPDVDYDPVCFDIKSRTKNGDYRIVKIDHEQILCYDRVKVVAELSPSFEQLVRQTIERAKSR